MKTIDRENLVQALQAADNGTGVFTRKQIIETAQSIGVGFPAWLVNKPDYKVDRGIYNLTAMFGGAAQAIELPKAAPQAPIMEIQSNVAPAPEVLTQAILNVTVDNLVPLKDATYVPYGFFKDLKKFLQVLCFTQFSLAVYLVMVKLQW